MTLQAIETRYADVRFRSRLEARWAVFFDALGIEWIYEPEIYRLPNGRGYVPDFLLPKWSFLTRFRPERPGTFVEVKPEEAFYHDELKSTLFALGIAGVCIAQVSGPPDYKAYPVSHHGRRPQWERFTWGDEETLAPAIEAALSARF